jgi:hypothetical protein
MTDGGEVALLLRRSAEPRGGLPARARDGDAGRLRAEQMQPGAQRMRHDEARALGDRRIDAGDRIGRIEVELAQRLGVVRRRHLAGPAQGVAAHITNGHCRRPFA